MKKLCLIFIIALIWGFYNSKMQPDLLSNRSTDLDPVIELIIRWDIGKQNRDITNEDLLSLITLDLPRTQVNEKDLSIQSLNGIELLKNLKRLSIRSHKINDISPLKYLIHLQVLEISGSDIQDLSAVSVLINLDSLKLDNNMINDMTPIASLPRLRYLSLVNNEITDISPLFEVKLLEHVNLKGNRLDARGDRLLISKLRKKGITVEL